MPVRPDAISSKPRYGDGLKPQRHASRNPESKRSKRRAKSSYTGKSHGMPWSNPRRRSKGPGSKRSRRR